jgi:hypothetical protein
VSILPAPVRRVGRARVEPVEIIPKTAASPGQNPNQEGDTTMRFMMLVKASEDSESGALPSTEQLAEMGKYNEELVKAGVLLAAEGLQASSKGVRVTFAGKQSTVTDGPFTETKELIAGFWLIQVKTRDEAIEWASRIPFVDGEVELRQVFEAADFGAELTPELREAEKRLREQVAEKQ